MKKLLLLSLSALFGLTVQYTQAEKITLEVMHASPAHNGFHQQIADAFMKEHPDITIKFRNSPVNYGEAHQTILREAITNRLPDIYFSAYNLLPEVVKALEKRGQITPIDDLVAQENADWLETNYEKSMLKLTQVSEKLYGLPFNASTPVIFYNKDLVKQAGFDEENFPDTWEDIFKIAIAINQLGNGVQGLSFDINSWPDGWLWDALIMQQGADVLTKDGKSVAFGGKSGKAALELVKQMVDKAGMKLLDYDQSKQQFSAGKTGIIFSSPNGARAFEDTVGNRFRIGSAVFPVTNKEAGKVPTGGNGGLILTKDKARRQAAWEYLKFATGAKGQQIAVLGSGYMPTNKLALGEDYLAPFYRDNPNWLVSAKQINRAGPWVAYPGANGVKIWRIEQKLITDVMTNKISIDEALSTMVEKVNQLIEK